MRIAQINVVAGLSTGRVAAALCRMTMEEGHRALFCYGRDYPPGDVPSLRVGNRVNTYLHVLWARLTDRAGFFSRVATKKMVRQLKQFKPDLIHLHNLHGYYLHLPTLFAYLKSEDIPVVWTLHDCWAFTGHCAYYTMAEGAPPPEGVRRRASATGCERWLSGCGHCPLKRDYPASWVLDQSARNWREKRALFSGVPHMVLATPSEWLRGEVKRSFLGKYPVYSLPNGIDLDTFVPCRDEQFMRDVVGYYRLDRAGGRHLILSVAAVWDERKGLEDLIDLATALGPEYCVAAVGLDEYQLNSLPENTVLGVGRTGNVNDLCALYTAAELYLSLSHEETMGMTLVEALACGTQVLCYRATAMPEIVTEESGRTVPLGDIEAAAQAVREMCAHPLAAEACRARAAQYDQRRRLGAYLRLYENIYRHSPACENAVREARERVAARAGKAAPKSE